jgi:hypothetical protein
MSPPQSPLLPFEDKHPERPLPAWMSDFRPRISPAPLLISTNLATSADSPARPLSGRSVRARAQCREGQYN